MGLNKPGIYDEFKYTGHFWIPNIEKNTVSGTIIFSREGIRLELIGSMNGLSALDDGNESSNKYPVLFGECEQGPVTFFDGFEINKRSGYITTSILVFNKMIIGKHVASKTDLKINNLTLTFTNLESWFKYHPFVRKFDSNRSVIEVNHTEIFKVYVKAIDATISSNYTISTNEDYYKASGYLYRPEIDINTDDTRDLEWFENTSISLRNLLSILMNSPVFVESMIHEENRLQRLYIYSIPFKNYSKKEIERYNRMNFDLEKIGEDLDLLLNNWYSSKLTSSHLNYIKNIFDASTLKLEDIFLNYSKALESFHRDYSSDKGLYVEAEEYNRIVEIMLSSVTSNITPELRNKLDSTLKHANEFGFQRRIKELIKMLPVSLRDLILAGQKVQAFSDQVRNNRDYYTHFGNEPSNLYTSKQLIFMRDKLQIMALYFLLKALELKEETIIEGIYEDYYIMQRLKAAEDHF
ncbi:HEPN domain-containing protein [Brevibacillus porteri]|uniref:ApeA N-terminal domain 1-containing protein n=1 Tax=Brevibacillus porteri TaxID=2126350 RepID=UPI003D21B365